MVVLSASFIFHDLYFLKLFCELSFNLVLSDAFSSLGWFMETGVDSFKGEVTSLILTEDYTIGMTVQAGEKAQWLTTFAALPQDPNSVSRVQLRWFPTACISCFGAFSALAWP